MSNDALLRLSEISTFLGEEGYFDLRIVPGRGICGLFRFMWTTGLCLDLDRTEYKGRYCFPSIADARDALRDWDGEGDPPGEWIKYKGFDGERSRIPDPYE